MRNQGLSVKSKKVLNEVIGEPAGRELSELITQMAAEIETLRRNTTSPVTFPTQSTSINSIQSEQSN